MKQIILISHNELAYGMAKTVCFFAGKVPNLYYLVAYKNGDNEFPKKKVDQLIDTFDSEDQIFILTDLIGGSVNQNASQYISVNPNIKVITGMNLSLVLALVLNTKSKLSDKEIEDIIKNAAKQIVFMNEALDRDNNLASDDE